MENKQPLQEVLEALSKDLQAKNKELVGKPNTEENVEQLRKNFEEYLNELRKVAKGLEE